MAVISGHGHRPSSDPPRVVVGYDDSAVAVRALGWAVREARRAGAVLEIAVAWQPLHGHLDAFGGDGEDLRTATFAQDAVRLAHRIDPRVRTELVRHRGPAGRLLVRRSRGAQVVVLGTHSHLGIVGAVIGSTARYVVRHASVPVALLGAHAAVDTEHRVVVAATDSQIAPAVLDWVGQRAGRTAGAHLHVLDTVEGHTTPGVVDEPGRRRRERQAEQWHAALVDDVRRLLPTAQVTDELAQGRPGDVLAATLTGEDLVVIGIHDRHQRFELRTAPCPVVLVPEHHSSAVTTRRPAWAGAQSVARVGGP